uniref:50S ribosomal protein L19, chloroplastic n=1 Tax=Lotharella vacuolata TaxID=74820 RepID=A0A140JZT4_9EUKA|nr:50S ribosomal protein L19 [Lotharella vacuolata]BAU62611.1 50S ribosomal protein L19 [Lotharella vacuolata]
MKSMKIVTKVYSKFQKNKKPSFNFPKVSIGDLVEIKVLIKEGNKERLQKYQATIIAKKKAELIKVRRVFQGIGIEYSFPLFAPHIVSLMIKRHSKVRRSKLFYLRNRIGKKAQLKVKFILLKT